MKQKQSEVSIDTLLEEHGAVPITEEEAEKMAEEQYMRRHRNEAVEMADALDKAVRQ